MKPEEKCKCIIIDDEFLARKLLVEYVTKVPQLKLLGTFADPVDAIEVLTKQKVDIIYIDIEMNDVSGIDFIKKLPTSNRPLVIFVTAYSQYAVECFEIEAFEYLVKPTNFLRFLNATHKAIETIETQRKAQLWDESIQEKNKDHIIIKSDRKLIKIFHSDIYFIEGALEYVTFQKENEKIVSLYSLKKLEEELPANKFMRIHKSYIVNIDKISEINGNIVKVGNWNIQVSKILKSELLDKFHS